MSETLSPKQLVICCRTGKNLRELLLLLHLLLYDRRFGRVQLIVGILLCLLRAE